MRVAAECRKCRRCVLTSSALGEQAAERLRAHLREAHPEELEPGGERRFPDVLLSFDIYKLDSAHARLR